MDSFKLVHDEGRLIVEIEVGRDFLRKDVTEYFSESNPHDEWLDYKLGLKQE